MVSEMHGEVYCWGGCAELSQIVAMGLRHRVALSTGHWMQAALGRGCYLG